MLKITTSGLFSLRQLAEKNRTCRDISTLAEKVGLNRRHDREDEWADLPLRELCDIGFAAQVEGGVYRITASGRKAIAQ